MNDLNQLLHEAAGSKKAGRLNPQDLLSAGRRRVRHRRFATVGATVAATAVIAGIVATVSSPGDKKADVVDRPERGSSTYTEVRISEDEVEARCSAILNQRFGVDTDWVVDPTRGARKSLETREGFLVDLRPRSNAGEGQSQTCLIPQTPLIIGISAAQEEPVPTLDDKPAIADLCSRRAGYDVSGWEVVTAADFADGIVAMVMAENGYFAACSLGPDGDGSLDIDPKHWLDDAGYPVGTNESIKLSYRVDDVVRNGDGTATTVKYGVLAGLPDGYRVEASSADGRVVTATTTVQGAFVLVYQLRVGSALGFELTTPDGDELVHTGYPAEHGGL